MINGTLYTETNRVIEWSCVSTRSYSDPFNDIEVSADIVSESGQKQRVPAFWAGGDKWSFRYSTPSAGHYTYRTVCSDRSNDHLHGQQGQISVTRYNGKNKLLRHGGIRITSDRRHLEHHDGTPFFWLADSWWHGMTTRFRWPEDFTWLTTDRKEKGFSVIQFAIAFPCDIHPFDRLGSNEAGNPWDEEWKSVNPAYFDRTDKRLQHLVDEGIVPNIVGVWGYYMKFAGAEKLKNHWRYLIARYGAYPVVYTLCGESTLAWYDDLVTCWEEQKKLFRAEWSKVAASVKETDPYQRILTVHPGPNSGNFQAIDEMEHIDMVMLQSGHGGYLTLQVASAAVDKGLERYPDKPIQHGEVCFEGMEAKSLSDVQRYLFWSNMLKGTAGFSYGADGIWQFNTETELFGPSPGGGTWGNVSWRSASQYMGSTHVGIGKRILENLEWWKLVPAPHRIVDPPGEFLDQALCAEINGRILVAYLFRPPNRRRLFKAGGFVPNTQVSVVFADPLIGEHDNAISLEADSEGVVTVNRAPVFQDWVIILKQR